MAIRLIDFKSMAILPRAYSAFGLASRVEVARKLLEAALLGSPTGDERCLRAAPTGFFSLSPDLARAIRCANHRVESAPPGEEMLNAMITASTGI